MFKAQTREALYQLDPCRRPKHPQGSEKTRCTQYQGLTTGHVSLTTTDFDPLKF